jgi:hypothetical protein
MRRLFLLMAAIAASGCGLLGPAVGRSSLPQAIKLLELSKVENGAPIHSNDPALDRY